jgi:photosystem II stability/assembly factor-like uncharacterized protein
MKNISFTALLAFFFVIYSQNIHSQGLYAVCSGDGSTVIAAGKNGIIIRSTNGGGSWSSSIVSQYDIRSVHFSGGVYWAAGNNGTFFKSTDNGLSWLAQTITGNKDLRGIFFTNVNTGWIAGADGVVYKTINGGNNWSLQTTGTTDTLNSIKFTNSLIGWACGTNGTALKTINGGDDWYIVSATTNNELLSVDIKNNTVITTGVNSTVLKSTNSGNNWSSIDYKIITKSDVNSVYMFDENIHFTCGGGGFLRKSTDAGASYTFSLNPMFGDLFSMYFFNSNTGWAVSRKTYAVIKTTDGGSTWSLPEGTNISYSFERTLLSGYLHTFGDVISVFNPFNKNVVYTLLKEKIYRSSNLGDSWTNIITLPYAGTYSQFFAISPNDTNKMIALLVNPTKLYYTSNYGANWITTFQTSALGAGIPIEIDPNHPDTLYFGTRNGVFRSTNFGLNWTQINFQISDRCDIEISYGNSNNMVTASKNPAIVNKSTNGGLNFTITNYTTSSNGESPTLHTNPYNPSEFYHLFYFSNPNQDGIWKSTNNGSNWTKIYGVAAPWGITTPADDPNVIFCGLWDSDPKPALISTNGGANFFTTDVLAGDYNANIAIFAYDRGNVLFQQTDGIYKLRVVYDVPAIGITPVSNEVPKEFLLMQNYPNPFNPVTKIRFAITHSSETKLVVYDILGSEVRTLLNEELKAGMYEVDFSAGELPSGVYFYKLTSGAFAETKKMILLK